MSSEGVTAREFSRFADSMQASINELAESVKKLVEQGIETQKYIIHNDHQHQESRKRLTNLAGELKLVKRELETSKESNEESFRTIAAELEKGEPAWRFFTWGTKTGKAMILAALIALSSLAGKSWFEVITNKEKPSTVVESIRMDGE